MNIYFKNINIENGKDTQKNVNLLIESGVITHCDKAEIKVNDDVKTVEASNLTAIPGMFDFRVKVGEPGNELREDFESLSNSAANGGFTSVVIQPDTDPIVDDITVLEFIKSKTKNYLTDILPSASITQGIEGKLISPMLELAEYGAVYFTDAETPSLNTETLRRAIDYAYNQKLLIALHTQDPGLTTNFVMNESPLSYKLGLKGYPKMAEEIVVARNLIMAEYCGNARIHLQHISTSRSVELLRLSKANNPNLSAGVALINLILDETVMSTYDTNYKVNPPLRVKSDIDDLVKGLNDDTINLITSDHQAHTLNSKEVELENAPYGIIGLETFIGLILTKLYHTNQLTLKKIIEKVSLNPRKILNLPEVKIAKGEKANLTILDLNEEWTVDSGKFMSKATNTPFIGEKLKGKPKFTVNNSRVHECSL